MKHTTTARALALFALLAGVPAVPAQTPALLPYQGRVQTGSPPADFNGAGQFKFALVVGGSNVSVQATAAGSSHRGNVSRIKYGIKKIGVAMTI